MGRSSYAHARIEGSPLFTTNSKTGCPSWAISQASCTGAKGCSICKSCYGNKGRFRLGNVRNAMNRRLKWFNESSEAEVVKTIVAEIKYFGESYFRAHVTGDFQNVRSIRIWKKIATALPEVKFWFPTKAYRVKGMLPALRGLNALENVTIRPSAADFDVDAPEIEGLSAGATAYRYKGLQEGHFNCPGSCETCRVCWENSDMKIAYHFH